MICGQIADLTIRFCCKTDDEDSVFYETHIELSKLFRLEHLCLSSVHSVPRNSVFFWVDDKVLLMENSVYIALRKSKQVSARSVNVNAAAGSLKTADSFSGDGEDGANDRILAEMNSILVVEDERNVVLREEIEVGRDRVSALRVEAESILKDTGSAAACISTQPRASLQELELLQVGSVCVCRVWSLPLSAPHVTHFM